MTNKPSSLLPANPGFLRELLDRVRLVLRLMNDKRVPSWLKLLPIGALVYFVVPIDLTFGPLDDAAVLGLASYLFVELCPPAVVQEHQRALRGPVTGSQSGENGEWVIDGQFVQDEEKKTPEA